MHLLEVLNPGSPTTWAHEFTENQRSTGDAR